MVWRKHDYERQTLRQVRELERTLKRIAARFGRWLHTRVPRIPDFALQRCQAELFQARLQRPQIYADLLPLEFLIDLAKILDFAAPVHFLKNPPTAGHRQPFLNRQPPAFPFVHERQVGSQFLGEKNRAHLPCSEPSLGNRLRQAFDVSNRHFFDESSEQSAFKSAIVSKYFDFWAKVMVRQAKRSRDKRIAYLDLFAGPGRYKDGTTSTPQKVLRTRSKDADMSQMLVTLFNDKDGDNAQGLQKAIDALPDIGKLKFKPEVRNKEVGSEMVKEFASMKLVPTLFFVDPRGYKGLSLQLVNSVLKNWGCDCIFFFNYNRINMGLTNPAVRNHMAALFGESRVEDQGARATALCFAGDFGSLRCQTVRHSAQ